MNLDRMKKAEVIALFDTGLVAEVVAALPEWSELTPIGAVRARQALTLAGGIDGGEELATAAHHKQFREVMAELEVMFSDDSDEAGEFWQRMSSAMGD